MCISLLRCVSSSRIFLLTCERKKKASTRLWKTVMELWQAGEDDEGIVFFTSKTVYLSSTYFFLFPRWVYTSHALVICTIFVKMNFHFSVSFVLQRFYFSFFFTLSSVNERKRVFITYVFTLEKNRIFDSFVIFFGEYIVFDGVIFFF